jgi:hypothetical protein
MMTLRQCKDRYYETLKLSSPGWHEGKHDPWPYINYLLYTLLDAYKELERRVGQTASPKGAKTELVRKRSWLSPANSAWRTSSGPAPAWAATGFGGCFPASGSRAR